jgi:hypothetical protein
LLAAALPRTPGHHGIEHRRPEPALDDANQVSLIFGRKVTRRTPGRFLTRVVGRGTDPAIQIRYKRSKLKQYFKEGRALRTETTINDTKDFGVGRTVTDANWGALIQIGHNTNQRLLDHQLQACQCAPDATTLQRVVLPSTEDGLPAFGCEQRRERAPQRRAASR